MNMKVIGTTGEPAVVILLNVHAMKLTSKCLCLYTENLWYTALVSKATYSNYCRVTSCKSAESKCLWVLTPKWNHINTLPAREARETSWERKWKAWESWRMEMRAVKCCLLDITGLLHTRTQSSSRQLSEDICIRSAQGQISQNSNKDEWQVHNTMTLA